MLVDYMNDKYGIKPSEIIYITSRSLIVDQQTTARDNQKNDLSKFYTDDLDIIKLWNGEELFPLYETLDCGIKTMTFDKLIRILLYYNNMNTETLGEIKVVIFDEAHAIFSDSFIRDINLVKVWIRDNIYTKKKIFLGLTATAQILLYYSKSWGVKINLLNDKPLINYKARNLYCVDYIAIPLLFKSNAYNHITCNGKTLIMCQTVSHCYDLYKKIPNSAILISKSNKQFTDEMNVIRDYIVQYESLPDEVTFNGKTFPLKVLITTSTFREGINLNPGCGVETIICCMPDELHITQFMGRCRFDIENLVVVNEYSPRTKYTNSYITERREEFRKFIYNENSKIWFNSIKHLLYDDVKKPIRILLDVKSFRKYIARYWLRRRIITKEERNEIVEAARACNIIDISNSRITFNRVVKYISEELGFRVITKRCRINGALYTYKLIEPNSTSNEAKMKGDDIE